ncbi:MAG: hypothetical protein ACLUUO_16930 [Sellimonas intestinalis]
MQRKRKKLLCMTAAAVFVLSGLSGCHGKGQDTEGAPVVLEDASGEDGKEAKDGGVRDAGEDEQRRVRKRRQIPSLSMSAERSGRKGS